jgi:hypothetical protein
VRVGWPERRKGAQEDLELVAVIGRVVIEREVL